MDGFELARRLRERYGHDMVLIAVTGWGDASQCISERFSKCDHYLRKPIDLGALMTLFPPL
jgi:DNA-binding response OmpR family regulator